MTQPDPQIPTWKDFRKEWRRPKLWNTSESAKEAEIVWRKLPDHKKVLAFKYAARFQRDFRNNYPPETTMLHCCRYLSPRKEPFMNYEDEIEEEREVTGIVLKDGEPGFKEWVQYEIARNPSMTSFYQSRRAIVVPSPLPPKGDE